MKPLALQNQPSWQIQDVPSFGESLRILLRLICAHEMSRHTHVSRAEDK
jgi:hypothetical protein